MYYLRKVHILSINRVRSDAVQSGSTEDVSEEHVTPIFAEPEHGGYAVL
jgi:hypothetical protein